MGVAALTVVMGPALALLLAAIAFPAQAEVMATPPGSIASGPISVVTVSTVLPALTLFAPLLVVGVLAYLAAGGVPVRGQQMPPLFALPGSTTIDRWRDRVRSPALPEQYRSLLNPRALEAAANAGGPILWLAALVALAFAVTR